MSGTQMFDPAAIQQAVRKAGVALRETLDKMARRQAEARRNRSPERIDRESSLRLRQHIDNERVKGELSVAALAMATESSLGLLPDCKLFTATIYTEAANPLAGGRQARWCSLHGSEAAHPRWCFVALGFNHDGSL